MSLVEIAQYQGHAYFFLVAFLTIVLYAYIAHLYKAQRSGERDYEKYAKLALDDDIDSSLLENRRK
ncbi:cytochrome c oxidase, cbb3-type, CcoQ subunit [Campylobacter sp. Cr9]|uniref:cytochrome c oxidase, cbb3-type, CcoQ subunit n=1 Tax=unclassified Campylobacter TaxID=2593542 RepID=UPI001EFB885E|nr:cytochrome c oxidase, cbb3-type, CcoQ subunit [Campylobacter sp. RM5004]MBZ7985281.1 cytochrome c oxidase, cbb3-type, CcoQ subunit [Campylobacter sp. Cr9]ULO00922.1 cytochrome c oxidase CcoNOPQ, cbb3-type, subunit IV [Campylobacter sp. RM5004]